MFWSRVGRFANNRNEWHNDEWKLLTNHLTSDQKLVMHEKPYGFFFLHALAGAETEKSRKTPHRAIVIYVGSVDCGIMTSGKHILWRHLTDCPNTFLSCSRAFSCRCQVAYYSFSIESNSRRFKWQACKKLSLTICWCLFWMLCETNKWPCKNERPLYQPGSGFFFTHISPMYLKHKNNHNCLALVTQIQSISWWLITWNYPVDEITKNVLIQEKNHNDLLSNY